HDGERVLGTELAGEAQALREVGRHGPLGRTMLGGGPFLERVDARGGEAVDGRGGAASRLSMRVVTQPRSSISASARYTGVMLGPRPSQRPSVCNHLPMS